MAMVFLSHFSFSSLQTTIGDWVDIFNLTALFFLLLNNIFLHVFDIRDCIHPPTLYSPHSSRYARIQITNTLCREILVWQISYQNKRNLRQSNRPETATCPPHPTAWSDRWATHSTFCSSAACIIMPQRCLSHLSWGLCRHSPLKICSSTRACEEKGVLSLGTGHWGQLFAVFSISCTVGAWSLTGREHLGLS